MEHVPGPEDPERHLPPELLRRASYHGSEYAWRVEDIPLVIEAARAAGLVSVGGQLQFRFPGGVAEVWPMEVQPHSQMLAGLTWAEEVDESAKYALSQFRGLLARHDLLEEGRRLFPVVFRTQEQQGRNPRDDMWFVWYLNEHK
jgi:hypothetical protein